MEAECVPRCVPMYMRPRSRADPPPKLAIVCRGATCSEIKAPSPSDLYILSFLHLTIMPGWASAYVEVHTLDGGHSDTINHLSFSPDGIYLASCSDDQSLIVWNIAEGRLLYRVLFKSKVDRVLWHPTYPATLVVGCENGYLYQLHDFSPVSDIPSPAKRVLMQPPRLGGKRLRSNSAFVALSTV